jgi:DNA polymerase III delta prime subunit
MLNTAIEKMWTEKYRPKTLDEYIFQNHSHKKSFESIISSKSTPHLLLSGVQGTGKTAIAKIIIDSCIPDIDDRSIDLLKINASDDNSVDVIREEVRNHIMSYASGDYKIVWLEEADRLTPHAQDALRDYFETYEQHCRFILTCNHVHRILPAIQSRCQRFVFSACNKDDATEMVAKILIKEKVSFKLPVLDKHVDLHYPDIRSIINSISQFSHDGILNEPEATSGLEVAKLNILEYIESDRWSKLQTTLCATTSDDEWEEIYEFLYQNLDKSPKFKKDNNLWGEGIILISDHLVNHYTHGKPHINAASMLIQLQLLT